MGGIITFEGIDGAGKSTLANLTLAALDKKGIPVAKMVFPSKDGEIGRLIRKVFSGEAKVDKRTMLYLFVADGIDLMSKVEKELLDGKYLILDRHPLISSWAYQTEEHSLDETLAVQSRWYWPPPYATFILDLPGAKALERLKARGTDGYFENVDEVMMETRRRKYLAYYAMHGSRTLVLDAERDLEVNLQIVMDIISEENKRAN